MEERGRPMEGRLEFTSQKGQVRACTSNCTGTRMMGDIWTMLFIPLAIIARIIFPHSSDQALTGR